MSNILHKIYPAEVDTWKFEELQIVHWPDERLHKKCEDVTEFDDHLVKFVTDMIYTMRENNGVGLAAPQVGIPLNVIVLWIDTPENSFVGEMINPEIIEVSNEMFRWEEGCLSVPGYYEDRERPKTIRVRYHDMYGKLYERELSGLAAFAVQHEIDHLNGKVFIDSLSQLKKDRIKKKISKFF